MAHGFRTVYFYYGTYDGTHITDVKAYFYFDPTGEIGDIESRVQQLASNAHQGGNDPPQYGSAFDELVRRKKGYFAVAVDAGGEQLVHNHPFTFEGPGTNNNGQHTFKQQRTTTLPGTPLTIGYCEHHMKKHGGNDNDLGEGEFETYRISLNFPDPIG